MSVYSRQGPESGSPYDMKARAERAQRFWLWFWAVLAAAFLAFCLSAARDAAAVLIAGFLTHPHG